MPTISLSTNWATLAVGYAFGLNSSSTNTIETGLLPTGGPYSNGSWSAARIDILKGSVPIDLTGLSTADARSEDVLISFKTPCPNAPTWGTTTDFQDNNGLSSRAAPNPVTISTFLKAATATGTATWFRWMVLKQPSHTVDPSSIIYHQIVGSVSGVGGNGDLQMSDTNIVAGQQYRIAGLQYSIPLTYTY